MRMAGIELPQAGWRMSRCAAEGALADNERVVMRGGLR